MSSASYEGQQERKRERSVPSGSSATSPISSATFFQPSPATSRFQSSVAKNKFLPPILESGDSAPPADAWTDNPVSLSLAQARDDDKLDDAYRIRGFSYHLCHIEPSQQVEEYVLSGRPNRFFIWFPFKAELRYIRTPWSLEGLRNTLNSGQSLETQLVRKWSPEPLNIQDIMPCPHTPPPNWLTGPDFVLCNHEEQDFRLYDLHHRRPILFYDSRSGDDDADYFSSEGSFYLYLPFHGMLYELPDMKDSNNFHKLWDAPRYKDLQLVELGPAEILGGRRILDQAALPPGWTQVPWTPEQEIPALPARYRHLYKSSVLTSADGDTHIVEAGYDYYIWYVTTNAAFKIAAPGGLQEILAALRLNLELEIMKE